MNREETIQYLLDNMFTNPTPNNHDWEAFLAQMTDEEVDTLMRVQKLENDGVLTPGDLMPMVEILEKYTRGKGLIIEHYDPDWDRENKENLDFTSFSMSLTKDSLSSPMHTGTRTLLTFPRL